MNLQRREAARRAVTLIEVVTSIAVASMLSAAALAIYAGATTGWDKARRRIDMQQRGRVSLDLISRCVRGAHIPVSQDSLVFEGEDKVSEEAAAEAGDAAEWDLDTLTIRTNAPIQLFRDEALSDQAELQFYIEAVENEETGEVYSTLYMRVDATPDSDSSGGGWIVEVAGGVQEMNMTYFDGAEWVESWSSERGAPKAIEAAIVVADLDGIEKPLPMARVILVESWREAENGRGQTARRGADESESGLDGGGR
jgi:prepilin-type N-terminal cleavage/methylation domain-containing protein